MKVISTMVLVLLASIAIFYFNGCGSGPSGALQYITIWSIRFGDGYGGVNYGGPAVQGAPVWVDFDYSIDDHYNKEIQMIVTDGENYITQTVVTNSELFSDPSGFKENVQWNGWLRDDLGNIYLPDPGSGITLHIRLIENGGVTDLGDKYPFTVVSGVGNQTLVSVEWDWMEGLPELDVAPLSPALAEANYAVLYNRGGLVQYDKLLQGNLHDDRVYDKLKSYADQGADLYLLAADYRKNSYDSEATLGKYWENEYGAVFFGTIALLVNSRAQIPWKDPQGTIINDGDVKRFVMLHEVIHSKFFKDPPIDHLEDEGSKGCIMYDRINEDNWYKDRYCDVTINQIRK